MSVHLVRRAEDSASMNFALKNPDPTKNYKQPTINNSHYASVQHILKLKNK